MSEQVSLDFLISLKQASSSEAQVKKTTGLLDWLAVAARKATDALFRTKEGKPISEEYEKAGKAGKSMMLMKVAGLRAMASTASMAFGTILGVTKWSIKAWLDHYMAMIKIRQGLGMTAEGLSEMSFGVAKAAANYGVSLGLVRDVTAYLVQGTRLGIEEAAKLGGAFAALADRGGMTAGTLEEMTNQLVGYGRSMDESGVLHNMLVLRTVTGQYNVSAEETAKVLMTSKEAWGVAGSQSEELMKHMTGLAVGAVNARRNMGDLGDIMRQVGNTESVIARKLKAGDSITNIFEQMRKEFREFMSSGNTLELQKRAEFYGISTEAARTFVLASEKGEEAELKWSAQSTKSSKELQTNLDNNRTMGEKLSAELKTMQGEAVAFWDAMKNSVVGEWLLKTLESATATIRTLTDLISVKKSAGEDETARADVVRKAFWKGLSTRTIGMITAPLGWLEGKNTLTMANDLAKQSAIMESDNERRGDREYRENLARSASRVERQIRESESGFVGPRMENPLLQPNPNLTYNAGVTASEQQKSISEKLDQINAGIQSVAASNKEMSESEKQAARDRLRGGTGGPPAGISGSAATEKQRGR